MKVLIVSDIHGNYMNMKKVIENHSSFDYLLLLGDILSGPDIEGYNPRQLAQFLNLFQNKIICVRGNCDGGNSYGFNLFMDQISQIIPVDHHLFFMTHGHMYSPYELPNVEFDVFLSGHTHRSNMEKKENHIFINPGSITLPRGGSIKSYVYYQDGVFSLIDLEKNKVLKSIEI